MDHDQLIDLIRRALKLARDKTTDLAPAQHTVDAREYTSRGRHDADRALLMSSPQLVGYVSELPRPGSYCTKSVGSPIRAMVTCGAAGGPARPDRLLPPPRISSTSTFSLRLLPAC